MRVSFASARRWSLIARISPVSGAFFGESFGLRFAYGALGGSPWMRFTTLIAKELRMTAKRTLNPEI
jgi:hypothetical protein